MAAVNASALGPQGLAEVAEASVVNAHRLASRLREAGLAPVTEPRFFNEFVLPLPLPAKTLRAKLAERGLHAGVPVPEDYGLGEAVVLAATELTTDDEIAALARALGDLVEDARPLEVRGG
jgi:glycine dehydrogenase subunit 1